MTLDEAADRFEAEVTRKSASDLLRVAREYHSDGMIADVTLAHIARKAHKALRDIAFERL